MNQLSFKTQIWDLFQRRKFSISTEDLVHTLEGHKQKGWAYTFSFFLKWQVVKLSPKYVYLSFDQRNFPSQQMTIKLIAGQGAKSK